MSLAVWNELQVRTQALVSLGETGSQGAVPLRAKPLGAEIVSSHPGVGRSKIDTFHLPYPSVGESLPVKKVVVQTMSNHFTDEVVFWQLPGFVQVNGISQSSQTPYGKFDGLAVWFHWRNL